MARLKQDKPGADEILPLWDDYLKTKKQQVSKAHRLFYHSTLGLGLIKKRRRRNSRLVSVACDANAGVPSEVPLYWPNIQLGGGREKRLDGCDGVHRRL